jgi:hypothetical protein
LYNKQCSFDALGNNKKVVLEMYKELSAINRKHKHNEYKGKFGERE